MTPITLIAAVAENGVIGRDNAMPWRIPSDFRLFRHYTLGHPVVMGRKNYLAIGRPLPGRLNIVLSRRPLDLAGCVTTTRLDDALAIAHAEALRSGSAHIMVIGGAEIYALTLPLAQRLLISRVHAKPPGETVFPAIDPARWRLVSAVPQPREDGDEHGFTLEDYARRG